MRRLDMSIQMAAGVRLYWAFINGIIYQKISENLME